MSHNNYLQQYTTLKYYKYIITALGIFVHLYYIVVLCQFFRYFKMNYAQKQFISIRKTTQIVNVNKIRYGLELFIVL